MEVKGISAHELWQLLQKQPDLWVIDLRDTAEFLAGHVPGSLFTGPFPEAAQWIRPLQKDVDIWLVCPEGQEQACFTQVDRLGIGRVAGYLQGGYAAWQEADLPYDLVISIESDELAMDLPYDKHLVLIDLRDELSFAGGHVQGSEHLPLEMLWDPGSMAILEETDNLYLMGHDMHDSAVAASLLKRQGFHNLRIVDGGWSSVAEMKKIPLERGPETLN